MKILIGITYYTPNKSGLTVYVERLANALSNKGHAVDILTSLYKKELPKKEFRKNLTITRIPIFLKVSKGVIMPSLVWYAWRKIKDTDVVNLHLPQFDAPLLAMLAKLFHKPVIITYHCDLELPQGWLNKFAGHVIKFMNFIACTLADTIIHNTLDFAENSQFLKRFKNKIQIIPPPIDVATVSKDYLLEYKKKLGLHPHDLIIGMAARLATEKGVEYLVKAMNKVLEVCPNARVLFAGEYKNVIGEEVYKDKIMPLIENLGSNWIFLGVDSELDRAAFYQTIDLLVMPSINKTESFGMVQIEAMYFNKPVVSTDLPGVRYPVQVTGMGEVVKPRDSEQLAQAILRVLSKREKYSNAKDFVKQFEVDEVTKKYECLFKESREYGLKKI